MNEKDKDTNYLHSEITGKVLQVFYKVYNGFGIGFPKKLYINALIHELRKAGLSAEQNKSIQIFYDQIDIGDVLADIVVDNLVLLEVHTDAEISTVKGQILYNKLRSSIYEVGLLLNFGQTPEHLRKVCTNDRKVNLS
jgi:GxxExxY protein